MVLVSNISIKSIPVNDCLILNRVSAIFQEKLGYISENHQNKISQKYGIELVADKTKSTNRFAIHNQIGNSENVKYYLSKRKPTKVPTLTASGFAIYHDSEKSIF